MISLVDMGTPQDAQDNLKAQVAQMLAVGHNSVTQQQTLLGDLSYWITSDHADEISGTKDQYVYRVLLGGNIGDPESHKAALQALASILASRL